MRIYAHDFQQGPNHGVVDFGAAYGLKTFYIIDQNGKAYFKGPITLRRSWNQMEVGDGYSAGIDVADLSHSWTVTSVRKGNPTIVECRNHPFVNGDKVRFRGMSGMHQLEGTGATGAAGSLGCSDGFSDRRKQLFGKYRQPLLFQSDNV